MTIVSRRSKSLRRSFRNGTAVGLALRRTSLRASAEGARRISLISQAKGQSLFLDFNEDEFVSVFAVSAYLTECFYTLRFLLSNGFVGGRYEIIEKNLFRVSGWRYSYERFF